MLEAEGHAAIGEMVAGAQTKFPVHRFRRLSAVDMHHDQLRFVWDLVTPDTRVEAVAANHPAATITAHWRGVSSSCVAPSPPSRGGRAPRPTRPRCAWRYATCGQTGPRTFPAGRRRTGQRPAA